MTPSQRRLFDALSGSDRTFPHEELARVLWGEGPRPAGWRATLGMHVQGLRREIETRGLGHLHSERGVGYTFTKALSPAPATPSLTPAMITYAPLSTSYPCYDPITRRYRSFPCSQCRAARCILGKKPVIRKIELHPGQRACGYCHMPFHATGRACYCSETCRYEAMMKRRRARRVR